jgi:hypothetical protein
MAPKKPRTQAPEPAGIKSRTLKETTLVGRAAGRLLELEVQEREELAKCSPEAIKAAYAEKRAEVLSKLTESQRKGAEAMAAAMRPTVEGDAKAAAE